MAVSVWVCFRTSGEYLYKRSRRSPGVLPRNSPGTLPALSRSSHGALSALSLAFSRRSAGALPGALELFPRRSLWRSPRRSPRRFPRRSPGALRALPRRSPGALPGAPPGTLPALSRHLSSAAPVRNFIPDPQILSIICDAARHTSQVPRLRAAPGRPTFRGARKKVHTSAAKCVFVFASQNICSPRRSPGALRRLPGALPIAAPALSRRSPETSQVPHLCATLFPTLKFSQ